MWHHQNIVAEMQACSYRTVEVLFNASTSGAAVKERVSSVILHELAHQWFGNLVTMKFWEGKHRFHPILVAV